MKIKFFANCPPTSSQYPINPAFFYIKHYYDLHGLNPKVEWLTADLFLLDDFETVLRTVEQDQPDVVAFSIFLWNETFQNELAQEIKKRWPEIITVAGGPQLVAHKDPDFFNRHPYFDYIVYGDGESAFQQIIDHTSGYLSNKDQFSNIVEPGTVYPFKQLTDEAYFSSSPILHQQEFIVKHITDLEARDVPRSKMIFGIEFARGCMYNCTFCDWGQNLTKKVKRRRIDWRAEIDFFYNQDLAIRETDANFGQWDEDIEVFRYALSLYRPGGNFKFAPVNTPKIKKKNTFEILKANAEVYGLAMKISLQDIDESVLHKIERPSLSWEDHKRMISDLRDAISPEFHKNFLAELMVGIPGQTYDSLSDTVKTIITEARIDNFFMNHWLLLPNSPGADPFYQKLHKLKWIHGYAVNKASQITDIESLEEAYQKISVSRGLLKGTKESTFIYATENMKFDEMIAIHMIQTSLIELMNKFGSLDRVKSFSQVYDIIKKRSLESAKKQLVEIQPMVEKYGFVIFGSYVPKQQIISWRWTSDV
jgi:radical SAM superfamily enzyme YgiQ (UPF0313 family)